MSVDKMQAGAELDALVDEKVFGNKWTFASYVMINGERRDGPTWLREDETSDDPMGGTYAGQTPPHYSTDIKLAWQAVEKLCLHLSPFVDNGKPYAWVVSDRHNLNEARIVVDAPTAPLAICRAALKAVGE